MTEERTLRVAFIDSITLFIKIKESDGVYFEQFMDTLYNQPDWPHIDEICKWLYNHDIEAYATGEIDSTAPMSKSDAVQLATIMNKYFQKNKMLIPAEEINKFIDNLRDKATDTH